MKYLQSVDAEIKVFGMVEIDNGDNVLGTALSPERDAEYWDIHLVVYPEGFDENSYTALEIEDITTIEERDRVLKGLEEFFPDAGIELL